MTSPWVRRLFSSRPKIHNATRLTVEAMESRLTPAGNSWTGAVDGSWNNPANWSLGVPLSGDDVAFDTANLLGAMVTATTQDVPNLSLNSVSFAGGSAFMVNITGTNFAINGSIFDSSAANDTITGTLASTGLNKSGTGQTTIAGVGGTTNNTGATGLLQVTGGTLVLGPNFAVDGAWKGNVTVDNTGTLQLAQSDIVANNSDFTVNTGGTLDMSGRADAIGNLAGGGNVTNNSGLTFDDLAVNATFSGNLSGSGSFNLRGTVSAGSQTLNGGTISASSINISTLNGSSGNTLNITGASTAITVTNFFLGERNNLAGNVNHSNGAVTVNGQMRIGHWPTETSTYTMSGGSLNLTATSGANPAGGGEQNGTIYLGIDGTGILNQSGGSISAQGMVLDNRTDTGGADTYTMTGGTLTLGSWSFLSNNTNNASKQINLQAGTVRASATWSSSLNMALTSAVSPVTFDPQGNTITLSGSLSGVGGLIKEGSGTLVLSGNSNYSGTTTINNGTLRASNSNALGNTTGGTIINTNAGIVGGNGVVLDLQGSVNVPETITMNSNGGANLRTAITNTSGANTLSGSLILQGSGPDQIFVNSGTLNVTAPITGPSFTGTFVIRGSGGTSGTISNTVTLPTGNLARTDTTLWILNSTGNTWLNTGISTGELRMAVPNALPSGTAVTLGQGGTNTPTLNLNGQNQTIASLTDTGAGTIVVTSATAATLTINNASAVTYGASGGTLTGALSVTKTGAGQLTIRGSGSTNNTANGLLQVSGGTLVAGPGFTGDGAWKGDVTVNSTATLQLAQSDIFANGSDFTINTGGTFNMAGFSDVIGNIQGGGNITNLSGTLYFDDLAGTHDFSGNIAGTGALYLRSAISAGTQTISGGTTSIGNIGIGKTGGNATGSVLAIAGTANVTVAGEVLIGDDSGIAGTLDQSGGTLNVQNRVRLGHWSNETSAFNLSGGILNVTNALNVGWDGIGLFMQTGGQATVGQLVVDANGATTGVDTFTLDGGTFTTGSVTSVAAAGSYLINLGGGTLRASTGFSSSLDMVLTDAVGAAIVDTQGNAVTLTGTLSGPGGLTKQGTGTLTIAGSGATNNSAAGVLQIDAGTVIAGAGFAVDGAWQGDVTINSTGTLQFSQSNLFANAADFTINPGGTLNMNGQSDTVGNLAGSGGSITNLSGILQLDDLNTTTSYNGNITGSGSLQIRGAIANTGTQTLGGGTVSLGAIHIGRGTLAISGAAVTLTGSTIVGTNRSDEIGGIAAGAATGVLNVTAGSLTTAAIVAGNRIDSSAITGTINQSGGAVTTTGSSGEGIGIRLGHWPASVTNYNLSGGTLDVNNGFALSCATDGGGTFTQTGGIATATQVDVNSRVATSGNGTFTLNGGTFNVGSGGIVTDGGGGPYTVNLGGGTLVATASFTSILDMNLTNAVGPAVIDTQGNTVTLSGTLSGAGGLTKIGSGTLVLNNTNSFGGNVVIGTGQLRTDVAGALPSTAVVTLGQAGSNTPTFNLNGQSQTIAGLTDAGTGTIITTSATAATLTINNSATFTYGLNGGALTGALSLTKTGTGQQTIRGSGATNNTANGLLQVNGGTLVTGPGFAGDGAWSGNVTINSTGTLQFAQSNIFANGADFTVNTGGTLNMNGQSDTLGNLAGTGGSITNLSGVLQLDDLNTTTSYNGNITGSGSLQIRGAIANTGTQTLGGGTVSLGAIRIGRGTLAISGAAVTLTGATTVGTNRSDEIGGIAAGAATGVLNVTAGSLTTAGIVAGDRVDSSAITGTINQSGGAVTTTGDVGEGNGIRLGHWPASVTNYNLSGGTLNVNNGFALSCATDGGGTFTQTGGTASATQVDLNSRAGAAGNGTFNLNGGTFNLGSGSIVNDGTPFTVNFGGGTLRATAAWTVALPINLTNAVGPAIIDSNGFTVGLSGLLSGGGGLTKIGAGTLNVTNNNTYAGATTVAAGTLSLANANNNNIAASATIDVQASAFLNVAGLASSRLDLASGQTLIGSGTATGSVTGLSGSTVSPGASAGTLTVSADFTLNSGSDFVAELDSAVSADQLVASNVTLAGTLTLNVNYTPGLTDEFILIDNVGSNPVNGTFAGLPAGSIVGGAFRIFYTGGTGNDVVLKPAFVPVAYVDDDWASLNFADPVSNPDPETGVPATAIYGYDAFATISDALAGVYSTTGIVYVNNGSYAADSATLVNDQSVRLLGTGPGPSNPSTITVGALATSSATATLVLGLANANSFIVGDASTFAFDGVVSGSGSLTKQGSGTMTLSNAGNSFNGAAAVNGGVLSVPSITDSGINSPLGAGTPINLGAGTLHISGAGTFSTNRPVTLGAATSAISNVGTLTLNVGLAGAGGLIKLGAGTLVLPQVSTYGGSTTVSAGTLTVTSGNSIPDASATTVGAAGTLNLGASETVGFLTLTSGTASGASVLLGGNTLTLNADAALATSGTGFTPASVTGAGAIDLGGVARVFTVADGSAANAFDLDLAVVVANGGLTKDGPGSLRFSGSNNTYTGQTLVADGTLILAKSAPTNGAVLGSVVIGNNIGGSPTVKTAILRVAANEQIADGSAISFVGNDGRLLISAGVSETITTPTTFADGDVKIAGALTTLDAYAQDSGSTTLAGGTLTVGGAGTLNSSLGSQTTPGGMLQGSGTIYTNILTSWGTIDPSSGITDADVGNQSPGFLNIRGNLQMTPASVTNLDVGDSGSDQLNVGINTALPLPAGSYTDPSNYILDPYLRGDVAGVTEPSRRGINDVMTVNGVVRLDGTRNTRPIEGSTIADNVTYGNSMNFVWRAMNIPMAGPWGDLNPRGANLSSVPSDFQFKNSLDEDGMPTTSPQFEQRYMGSGGQFNAIGQSVATMTKIAGVSAAVVTAPAYSVGQAKAMTLTSLTSNAAPDTIVKVTKQLWNAMKDSHSRVSLTITNTSATAQTGPFYVEILSTPNNVPVFNSAGISNYSGKPYLVVPAVSLAGGASVTVQVDLLTPFTIGKYASLSLRILRGGMP